ncbi:LTA synthase family protein [Pelagicoccus sp. SDUM812002]|uniref:LTA synthase family protein n=1 Tax=Pelagicoccus sp. SDUM812002 TaxID=3041266 RepID=UPI00280F7374|nr:LTA synthase family protein [Pelagicoccus sp. SDUM812002]MDQ8186387.1 LTA synthase family protein [Pelagicoccus sp. SDUM812002]
MLSYFRKDKAKRRRLNLFHLWLFVCACLIVIICTTTVEWRLVNMRYLSRHIVKELGFVGYLTNELTEFAKRTIEEFTLSTRDTKSFREYMEQVHEANRGSQAPSTSGQAKHLVYIQMESVDGLSIESTLEGMPLMPFLYVLRKESTYFPHTIDNTSSGRTTDGELLTLTSLPSIYGQPAFQNFDLSKVPSLPRVFNDAGYYTFSIHGYKGSFWNRAAAHSQLGFQDSFFRPDLIDDEIIGWGISDESILNQAAEKIVASDLPTFAHIILLTNHHPYRHVAKRNGKKPGDIVLDHIASLRYMDSSIQSFFEKLDEQGILENSIVAIYGDHDSAIRRQIAERTKPDFKQVVKDKVPLLIYGLNEPPKTVEKLASLQDLPVIALQELGLLIPSSFTGNALHSIRPVLEHKNRLLSIDAGEVKQEQTPFDTSLFTKMAILHPERMQPTK